MFSWRDCELLGQGLTAVYLGQPASFMIVSKDQYECQRNEGGDAFKVAIFGPGQVLEFSDNGPTFSLFFRQNIEILLTSPPQYPNPLLSFPPCLSIFPLLFILQRMGLIIVYTMHLVLENFRQLYHQIL